MKRRLSAVDARQKLGDVLSGVFYRHDEVIIERAGKPMAAVVPMRIYEAYVRERELMLERIEQTHEANKHVTAEEAEEAAVEAVRAYRREKAAERTETEAKAKSA
jgi:prevent-host-death family protein